MKKKPTLWYLRSEGIVTGPFLASVVRDNLLLGRLDADKDEVSSDGMTWKLIKEQKKIEANYNHAYLDRIQERLNERNGFDRRYPQLSEQEQSTHRKNERRQQESEGDLHHRQFHTLLKSQPLSSNLWAHFAKAVTTRTVIKQSANESRKYDE